MIKYRTYFDKIENVEVLRETVSSVYVQTGSKKGERREAKRSSFYNDFDSWQEAHAFLVSGAESSVEELRMNLERAKGRLGQIRAMKQPLDTGAKG